MLYIFVFLIGMIITSGLTCYWQRGWHDFCDYKQRSYCPHCYKVLAYWQLVPMIGWLAQKGRCQNCQQAIHLIYPVMEIWGGLWAIIIMLQTAPPLKIVIMAVTGLMTAKLIFIDTMTYRLPQIYTVIIGLIGWYYHGEWLTALLLGTSFWLIKLSYQWYAGKNVLGSGDIKLGYALGLWLPISLMANFYIITGAFGIAWGYMWCRQFKVKIFPFAPCLLLSFTCLYLYKIASSH